MTYFGILQTLKVCAVVSCILQKRKVYGHRIYKCEIRYIYKCKSLGELTSASREDKSLYFRSKLVSSTPRPFGEITVLGLIKCRQKQKKKDDKTHQSLVQRSLRIGRGRFKGWWEMQFIFHGSAGLYVFPSQLSWGLRSSECCQLRHTRRHCLLQKALFII